MKKYLSAIAVLLCFGLLFASCKKDDPVIVDPTDTTTPDSRTGLVTITPGLLTPTTITCSFAKSDSCDYYSILAAEPGTVEMYVGSFFGNSVEEIIESWSVKVSSDTTYTWEELKPAQTYVIYALAHSGDSTVLYTDTLSTIILGGHGTSVITLNVTNIGTTTATTIATPNAETAVFKEFLCEAGVLDTIPTDTIIAWLRDEPYDYYETDTWLWETLNPGTEYIFLAQGKNIDGEWGELARYTFTTLGSKSVVKHKSPIIRRKK